MTISITYDKADMKAIRERIQLQLKNMREMQTPLSMIAVQLYQSVMQNFRDEGTDKHKWKALSQWTLWIKKRRATRKETNPKILQDSGYMRMSVVPNVGDNYAKVGTNIPYAETHQKGGYTTPNNVMIGNFKRKSKLGNVHTVHAFTMHMKGGHKVPARPFLTIRDANMQRIKSIARNWFFEGKA